jgi:serine/threonine protein kinase
MKHCPECQQQYPNASFFCLEDGEVLSLQDPYYLIGRTLLDKLKIQALVGLGGMGAVYHAHHLALDTRVAFKILQPNRAHGDEKMLGLFEREAKIAGRVRHDNVAMVTDAGRTSDGIAYIIMEWLHGRTLQEDLTERSTFNFARTAEILRQVAAALQAAHDSNVIHLDLKPANIILARQPDGSEKAKVLDFGIAKVLSPTTDVLVTTPMGTPHYASPEQLISGSTIDTRTDIYSLGVLLYRMLTGVMPFNTSNVHELIRLQRRESPPPLRTHLPDAPVALERLISQLLERNPGDRPARVGNIPRLFEEACAPLNKGRTVPIAPTPTDLLKPVPTLPTLEAKETSLSAREEWYSQFNIVRARNLLGDMMLLAEEAPSWELRFAAHRTAGNALLRVGRFSLALAEYEKALLYSPADLESRRQKGVVLGRLKQAAAAKEWLQKLVNDYPEDAQTWGLLGRVQKEGWMDAWRYGAVAERKQLIAAADGLLEGAIAAYLTGFAFNASDYYPGINALTLIYLREHLLGRDEHEEEKRLLEGGVRWALHCALKREAKDYWAKATCAELEVLTADRGRIEEAWRQAVAVADDNWFALDSSQQQLLLLKDAGFRPAEVEAALNVLRPELQRLRAPEAKWMPRQVFLFSGHMIDDPHRDNPRFPADKESAAAAAIGAKLDELGAGVGDLALCSGACGGDLLFAEACLARGLWLEMRIPFSESEFIAKSVDYAGAQWRARFEAVKRHLQTKKLVMPEELGANSIVASDYARNNLWMMYNALAWGPEKMRFISLWDGQDGDAPDGTKHLIDAVSEHITQIHILDMARL